MESGLWRPFVQRLADLEHPKITSEVIRRLREAVVGEMTGGDRALISSLEGLEDLQLVGRLQVVQDHGFREDDILFAVTEGGETSSVIGAILGAAEVKTKAGVRDAHKSLYFVYNNPDRVLKPLRRSKAVLEDARISKMRLWTGPQAVTGSTRMQATTIETFVCGLILQEAARLMLEAVVPKDALKSLGFDDTKCTLREALSQFSSIQSVVAKSVIDLSALVDLEACAYSSQVCFQFIFRPHRSECVLLHVLYVI